MSVTCQSTCQLIDFGFEIRNVPGRCRRFAGLMRVHVSAEIDLLVEIFWADIAFEGFESFVFPAVRDEVGGLRERFSAEVASVWFLSGVGVSVFPHVRLLVEPLAAEVARVGADVGVDHHVRGQRRGALEGFSADFTRVQTVLDFSHCVGEEGGRCGTSGSGVSSVHHLVRCHLLLHRRV